MLQIKTGKTKFNYLWCKYIANSKILLVNFPNYEITTSGHFIYRRNLGNRLENIERSLELIQVGTIIKVSRL
jgi:hypothetical protein